MSRESIQSCPDLLEGRKTANAPGLGNRHNQIWIGNQKHGCAQYGQINAQHIGNSGRNTHEEEIPIAGTCLQAKKERRNGCGSDPEL